MMDKVFMVNKIVGNLEADFIDVSANTEQYNCG